MDRRTFVFQAGMTGLFSAAALARGAGPDTVVRQGRGKARHCILVYLLGGPPHQDMWDLKPDAPSEIRGPFNAIATREPGIQISEHLPRLAQQTHRMSIVRSLGYNNGDHPFMTYYTLTGRISPRPLGANTVLPPSRDDDPHMGCVVSKFQHRVPQVPGYVAIPEVQVRMTMMPVAGGGRAGYLGPEYNPLAINGDPRQPGAVAALRLPAEVTPGRRDERGDLLALLDGFGGNLRGVQDYAAVRRRAAALTDSGEQEGLFALASEKPALRSAYGDHRFGQSLLLARRLVERGVSFVGVHFNNMTRCDGWDTHKNNFSCLRDELLPVLDQGLSALLDDLADRGLLDETLVVCMGEFGRTPRLTVRPGSRTKVDQPGRDHWPRAMSLLVSGGGMRTGQVIGATNAKGEEPVERAMTPNDLWASVYQHLGVDYTHEFPDHAGRPMPMLPFGEPIPELAPVT